MLYINFDQFGQYMVFKKGITPRTARNYILLLNKALDWFTRNDLHLNPENINKFFMALQQGGYKNSSINGYLKSFRHLQEFFISLNKPTKVIDIDTKSLEVHQENIDILTIEEIRTLINTDITYGRCRGNTNTQVLNHIYKTLFKFFALTGARLDEGIGLKRNEIDLASGKVTFFRTKNGQTRNVWIMPDLISDIKKIYESVESIYVFPNSVGNKFYPAEVWTDLQKRAALCGITKRVFPHLLRHSYATHLLGAGVDITTVATLLGHSDIQTTYKNYIHLVDDTLKRAIHRHPIVQADTRPQELLKIVEQGIASFNLESDPRFTFQVERSNTSLKIVLALKN